MLITLSQPVLLKALAPIRRVTEKRATRPILGNIHLNADNDQLILRGTNGEIELIETIPAQIQQSGMTSLPAHIFHEIVNRLPDTAEVTLKQSDDSNQVEITAGSSYFKLPHLPADDFPPLLDDNENHHNTLTFALSAKSLHHMIETVKIAASADENRYYLNGVHFHSGTTLDKDETPVLFAVATDGHRLARAHIPLPEGLTEIPGVIIPSRTCAEILRLLATETEDIKIILSEHFIRLVLNDNEATSTVLISRLVDGTFPDYQRVIPVDNPFTANLDATMLGAALSRVGAICSELRPIYPLTLDFAGETLKLAVRTTGEGDAFEQISVDYHGDELQAGFNIRYFSEIVQHINGDSIRITLKDANAPIFIQAPDHPNSFYVLMPMRL